QEDVQGIAVSSYQGGHIEFFKYMIDLLRDNGAPLIRVFAGGGGVIVPDEIRELEAYGVAKIYSPEDGARLGLQGIINHMVEMLDFPTVDVKKVDMTGLSPVNKLKVAHLITAVELAKNNGNLSDFTPLLAEGRKSKAPVIGITGTGGAGKSSLTDEIILRLVHDVPEIKVAIISCDPSRRKSGGALLGDRIRMNAIGKPGVYMRSIATRMSDTEIPAALPEVIDVIKASGFDLAVVETAGIGQGDSKIIDLVDISVYVMTSEFGAASQLEKIDMLDFADLVVINKFEKRGGADALRDVAKQVQRNKKAWEKPLAEMLVFGTIASKFNDDGVTALYHSILDKVAEKTQIKFNSGIKRPSQKISTSKTIIIPSERTRYLSEISGTLRSYHAVTKEQSGAVRKLWHLEEAEKTVLSGAGKEDQTRAALLRLKEEAAKAAESISDETNKILGDWCEIKKNYSKDELVYSVRDREIRLPLFTISLSQQRIPKISLPKYEDPGEILRWMREENVPGLFPFTAGVFPLKRADEDPTRMFAGEGDPARTNNRFKLLSANYEAKRLSTAFDSVTLFGHDPDRRPDIYGKVGTSGVSVCSLDNVRMLYDGFELCSPNTSVSMTINGPAPMMLAMFLNAAIDQQADRFRKEKGREPDTKEYDAIRSMVLSNVRGTVQADILKEDQGQNSCIFSIEFALKMMGDIQEYFIKNNVRNFYSVSISGYHIAEAGANPITQLA
ncbi:MAG: methylmalonyl-CoA mutase, partial [Proteobacteria bacterium]|nr:methylmalonyl-CoA mutase [Pseudomonadota bacterium]